MSFGFSPGDIFTVVKLAWDTYQGAKAACGDHDRLTQEVAGLHKVLQRVHKETLETRSGGNEERWKELEEHIEASRSILRTMDQVLRKYNALGDDRKKGKRLWQKIEFGSGKVKDLSAIREQLTTHTAAISMSLKLYTLGSLGRVETQLNDQGGELKGIREVIDQIAAEMTTKRNLEGEGSVWTAYENDDKTFWRELRRELLRSGYDAHAITKKKTLIKGYVVELGERGVFDEDEEETEDFELEKRSRDDNYKAAPQEGSAESLGLESLGSDKIGQEKELIYENGDERPNMEKPLKVEAIAEPEAAIKPAEEPVRPMAEKTTTPQDEIDAMLGGNSIEDKPIEKGKRLAKEGISYETLAVGGAAAAAIAGAVTAEILGDKEPPKDPETNTRLAEEPEGLLEASDKPSSPESMKSEKRKHRTPTPRRRSSHYSSSKKIPEEKRHRSHGEKEKSEKYSVPLFGLTSSKPKKIARPYESDRIDELKKSSTDELLSNEPKIQDGGNEDRHAIIANRKIEFPYPPTPSTPPITDSFPSESTVREKGSKGLKEAPLDPRWSEHIKHARAYMQAARRKNDNSTKQHVPSIREASLDPRWNDHIGYARAYMQAARRKNNIEMSSGENYL